MIYSISHTDLDGYSSQLIVKSIGHTQGTNVTCFNVNYGSPITEALSQVIDEIDSEDQLFITDLNLTNEQAEIIDDARSEIGFFLRLLDHHESGKNVAIKYEWYELDVTKCATQITYEYFGKPKLYEYLVALVNVYDLWKEEDDLFKKAKCLNDALMSRRNTFPNVLEESQRDYNLHIITTMASLLKEQSIINSEHLMYAVDREYFDKNKNYEEEALFVARIGFMYDEIMDAEMYTKVTINGHTGEIYTGLSSIFQEFSHLRLLTGEIDFVANINPQGYIGFRSKGDISVLEIARSYYFGGGHPNAAGGSIVNRKEVPKNIKFEEDELIPTFLSLIPKKIYQPKESDLIKFITQEEMQERFSDLRNMDDDGYAFLSVDIYDEILDNIKPDEWYRVERIDEEGCFGVKMIPGTFPNELISEVSN